MIIGWKNGKIMDECMNKDEKNKWKNKVNEKRNAWTNKWRAHISYLEGV